MTGCSRLLRRYAAILMLGASVSSLSACSAGAGSIAPAAQAGLRATSGGYIVVDDSACASNCNDEITGINVNRDVVGNWSHCASTTSGTCSGVNWGCNPYHPGTCKPCPLVGGASPWNAFVSEYGESSSPYASFTSAQFPDAPNGQYVSGISDRLTTINANPPPVIEVGCISSFAGGGEPGEEKGVWGLVYNNGLWSTEDKGPGSACDKDKVLDGTGELLGYDNSNHGTPTAVGFINNNPAGTSGTSVCNFVPAELQAGGNWNTFGVGLSGAGFTAANVMATGITGSASSNGYIVGTATGTLNTNHTVTQVGWLKTASGKTLIYHYPGSSATAFTGIAAFGTGANATYEIVGWYTLLSGHTHGVQVPYTTNLSALSGTSIPDPPLADGLTIVSGINALGDICGWYLGANGHYHGFVGLDKITTSRKRQHRHSKSDHVTIPTHPQQVVPL